MSGDFNLTRISFPIRCMAPQSLLMQCTGFITTLPVLMNKAVITTDPIERMKLVMSANFSWYFYNQIFHKPLNPILGETYQAYGQDGSKIFLEQTEHHPPRTHFYCEGANQAFKMCYARGPTLASPGGSIHSAREEHVGFFSMTWNMRQGRLICDKGY